MVMLLGPNRLSEFKEVPGTWHIILSITWILIAIIMNDSQLVAITEVKSRLERGLL